MAQLIARLLRLYDQEQTGASFAIARMNMVLHDMEGEIVRGNTMANPKFLDGSALKQFDVVVTNPMWNQDNFDPASYERTPFARFAGRGGFAPESSADWTWLRHVLASLSEHGRAAVVLDTGAASRGSGNQNENKEKTIHRWFVEQDVVERFVKVVALEEVVKNDHDLSPSRYVETAFPTEHRDILLRAARGRDPGVHAAGAAAPGAACGGSTA